MGARVIRFEPAEPSPAQLEACRRGDRAALGEVLRAHAPALRRQIAWILGPGGDVDDVLQVALLAAVEAFPRYRGEASLRTWLVSIAIHKARDHLRRPDARRRVALSLVPGEDARPDPGPAPDQAIDSRRRLERLYHHLAALGPEPRVAFVLHALEGHPIEEVAALMGASRVATKTRVFRARRALVSRARRDPLLRDLIAEEEP